MQHVAQRFWTTEEHPGVGRRVDLPDGFEDSIPIRTTEVGGRSQPGDGVGLCIRVINHDVGGIVRLDIGRKILLEPLDEWDQHDISLAHRMYLNVAIQVLRLNRHEQ